MSIETINRKNRVTFRAVVRIGHQKVSKTFGRKLDARAWEAAIKTKGSYHLRQARSVTLAELWERFDFKHSQLRNAPSTQVMNRSLFGKYLNDPFGKKRLSDLTDNTWETYFDYLREQGTSNGRINRVRQLLHVMFARAVKWKLVQINPITSVDKLPKDSGRDSVRYLSKGETYKLLEWLRINDPWLYPKIVVLIFTGIRYGEMVGLRVEDLKLSSEVPHLVIARSRCRHSGGLVSTKGKRGRVVPLGDGLASFLRQIAEGKASDSPLLWNDTSEGRWPTKATKHFKKALAVTGIPPITIHQLRHSYSVLFLEGNGQAYDLKEVLGHRDMKTTMLYSHFSPAMAERVRGVVDYVRPTPSLTVVEGGLP